MLIFHAINVTYPLSIHASMIRRKSRFRRQTLLGFSDADTFRRVVAMSKWWFPYTLTPEQEAARVGEDKLPEKYPAGAVRALSDSFLADLFEKRRKLLDHKTQYCMFQVSTVSCSEPVLSAKRMGSCEYSCSQA
jgi:hypothetical protein